MKQRVIRVLVVDDDPAVRRTVAAILEQDRDLHVVSDAANGREALEQVRTRRADVMLLDIRMPVFDGLATLEVLRREEHPVQVIILTTFGEADYVRQAITLGADGFLLKSGDPRELIRAVRGTSSGESWLSPAVARVVTQELRRDTSRRLTQQAAEQRMAELTPREQEVATLIASGATNTEIARTLFLSESTVKAYVGSAMERLGVRNRVELAGVVWSASGKRSPA